MIVVVGDSMLDRYWFGDVTRISPEAPVPIVEVEREEWRLGAAANVANNIKSLGGEVTLISSIAMDNESLRFKEMLKAQDIRFRLTSTPYRTTVKHRIIGKQHQMLRVDFEDGVKDDFTEYLRQDVETHYLQVLESCQAVVISDYGKGLVIDPQGLIQLAKKAGKKVFVDTKSKDRDKFAGAYLIKQNEHEFMGDADCEVQIVTKAEKGLSYKTKDWHEIPSEAREVFDVTGAGDTVIAGLALFIAEGFPLEEAVAMANKAAGVVVGKFGTSTVSRAECGLPTR